MSGLPLGATGQQTSRIGSFGLTAIAIVPASLRRPIQLRHDSCSQMRMLGWTILF